MKCYLICLIIIMNFFLSSCTDTVTVPNDDEIATVDREIIMRNDDVVMIKDYCNYVIDLIKANHYVKKDGSDDNLEGLSYALKQCAYIKNEPLGKREITPIVQNADNGLYVAEFDYDGWRVELLLISFEKGQISYIKEIGEASRNSTSMLGLKGFDEKFIQTFTATNMGNGYMSLITFDENSRSVGEFRVVDYHTENTQNPIVNSEYNLDEHDCISYVFGEMNDNNDFGILYPEYIDINNDGYEDVQFVGIQSMYSAKKGKIDEFNVKLIYIYNPKNMMFELSTDNSLLPNMWEQ